MGHQDLRALGHRAVTMVFVDLILEQLRREGDPVLRRRASPVEVFDDALTGFAERMFKVMAAEGGVGLAAPQVGVARRIVVVGAPQLTGAFVNPVLEDLYGSELAVEGCLSIPGERFEVPRATRLVLRAQDLEGRELTWELDGYEARVLQHEVDHLDGILIRARALAAGSSRARRRR